LTSTSSRPNASSAVATALALLGWLRRYDIAPHERAEYGARGIVASLVSGSVYVAAALQALLHRPLGPHAERESVGVLVEELVQRLHQGPLVDQPEPDTGHRQHRQDGERRDGGDAEAECSRHSRKEPTATAGRHGRGMR